ncbi:flavodoxin family protein [Chloroflexota bacterium]
MEGVKVKILGVSCAHRKGRNTAWLVQFSLKAIEKFGRRIGDVAQIETEFVDLANKKIKPCWDCELCYEMAYKAFDKDAPGKLKDVSCAIKDDFLATEFVPMMAEADGFVFGSPVFTFSYTSKFRTLFERLAAWQRTGWFTNKPAAVVAVGRGGLGGGQESCLVGMNNCIRALEMIPISWAHGACASSGPPLGPQPAEDDGKVIAVKNDRSARYIALVNARRVTETALMQKIAKQELDDLYLEEFIQVYHPPHGTKRWAWSELDEEDEEQFTGISFGQGS